MPLATISLRTFVAVSFWFSLPSPSDPTCFSVRFLGDQLHIVSSPWMMPMRAIWLEESCPIVRTAPKASPLSILRIQLVSAYGSTVIGCAWCLHQEGCRCALFGSRKAVRSCERPQRLHHEASCVCASFGSMKPNTYGAYTRISGSAGIAAISDSAGYANRGPVR